ncbi:MAG: hypothetical protein HY271_16880 [Deltaproteobacteria bacterium]|nr:hypothetical protein [Deltaproteobacteria bacterium]
MKYPHIAVVAIVTTTPSAWQLDDASGFEARQVVVQLRLGEMLRGAFRETSGSATIQQFRHRSGRVGDPPSFWSARELAPGKRYAVFAPAEATDLAEAFANPAVAEELIEGVDTVADLKFVIGNAHDSVSQQVSRLKRFLSTPRADQRSRFIAEYLLSLVVAPDGATNADVHQMIGAAHRLNLTEGALRWLLERLWSMVGSGEGSDDTRQALVLLSLRVLAQHSGTAATSLDAVQMDIVENYLPRIVHSNEVQEAIARHMNKLERRKILSVVQRLGQRNDLPAGRQSEMQALTALVKGCCP